MALEDLGHEGASSTRPPSLAGRLDYSRLERAVARQETELLSGHGRRLLGEHQRRLAPGADVDVEHPRVAPNNDVYDQVFGLGVEVNDPVAARAGSVLREAHRGGRGGRFRAQTSVGVFQREEVEVGGERFLRGQRRSGCGFRLGLVLDGGGWEQLVEKVEVLSAA
jgi:hypothetical protein